MATPQPKLRVLSDKGMVFTTRFAGAGRDTVITSPRVRKPPDKAELGVQGVAYVLRILVTRSVA